MLYERVPALRRRRLHRQVGEALAALPAPDPDAVAYHFQQAGDERAAAWLVRAGERAEDAYALVTAARSGTRRRSPCWTRSKVILPSAVGCGCSPPSLAATTIGIRPSRGRRRRCGWRRRRVTPASVARAQALRGLLIGYRGDYRRRCGDHGERRWT